MGKNQRLTPDPSFARPHHAEAKATIIQTLAHAQLGSICYERPRFWTYHYEASYDAYERLAQLLGQLVNFSVTKANMRDISNQEFLKEVYSTGTTMLSEVIRTVQHFAEEIERTTGQSITGSTVNERLRESAVAANLHFDVTSQGYAAFVEMQELRDAVEHPKASNTYAANPGDWDHVPLAWLLSDRSLRAYNRYHDWFTELADQWEAMHGSYARSVELQVERGIKSRLQFKKSPM